MSIDRREQFDRALTYYGLPLDWPRIFMPNGNGALYLLDADAATSKQCYAWVQLNLTNKQFPLKKPENKDIEIVNVVSFDFELPNNPALAHEVGDEFARWFSSIFYAGQGIDLPLEDTGAGIHLVIPIEPLNTLVYGGAEVVNTAIKMVVEGYIRDDFRRICDDHGVQMSLGAYDISRLLSAPGTYRPPSATKPDANFLLHGYVRRFMPPFDSIDPQRVECTFLRDLIIGKTDDAAKQHHGSTNGSTSSGASTSRVAQHDPGFTRWLESWVKRNPSNGNRSDYFHRLVCAAYRRMRGIESVIIDHADLIDDLSGSKYGTTRCVQEASRSLVRAKQMAPSVATKTGTSIQDYIDALESLGHTFRLNECGNDIEVSGNRMDMGLYSQICNQMYDLGFSNDKIVQRVWTDLAWSDSYHPVQEYLEQCGSRYDGGNYIEQVADCFIVNKDILKEDGLLIARTWLRKWFIGAVAKACAREQNVVLVLEGIQGIGKSTFVTWLSKDLPTFHIEEEVDLNYRNNDTNIWLTRYWIWELGELGGIMKNQSTSRLKAFFTKRDVVMRKPYDKHDTIAGALASFIATINESGGGFLSDPTGSRRFAIIPVLKIDFGYEQFSPAQLWGEAYTAYKAGEDWRITGELARVREAINQTYYVSDPVYEQILKLFDIGDDVNNSMTGSDIAMVLMKYGAFRAVDRSALTQVGIALRKLNVHKMRDSRNVWIYEHIRMKPLEDLAMSDI